LFVVLSTVGIVGFTVWKGTLPSREGILYPTADEVALHVPTPEKDKIKCLARLGIPDKVNIRYCSISSTDEPTVALIGDSHSAVLFHGLAYHLKRDHGKTVVNLGGRLFANVVNHPTGDEFEKTVYKGGFDVAEYVAGNKMLDTVIMVSRGFFYLNWADHFYIESKPYLTSKKEVFLEGLRDTLNLFRDRKVVFVLENPTMDSNPRSKCSSSRPINFVPQDFNCAVTREDDERVHNEYIASVRSVLENYSNVIVIDPRPVFCDQTYCYARKDGKLLYGNEDHLNRNGSLLHARQISKLLKSGTF
jgi:hypothetical protein